MKQTLTKLKNFPKKEETKIMKRTQKLLSILLTLAMVFSMVPMTATAAEDPYGVRPDSVVAGDLTCTVDGDGVLTWTDLPGATSYDLNIYMKGGLVKSETGLTSTSYNLEAMLDGYKKDSGTVTVNINVWGGSGRGGSANFLYSSPYPKLEAPTTLAWSDKMAVWNEVSHADNYQIWLYQPSGSAYSHWDTPNTYFNFVDIPAAANAMEDGWFFKVKATSTENYRDSEFNESSRRGYTPTGGVRAESKSGGNQKLTFTVDESGVLTWNAVPGAASYALSIWHGGEYFMNVTAMEPSYDLQALLEEYRKDHGSVSITITPDGENSLSYQDTASFLYSSPYGKLEAPVGLIWDGNIADWNDVPYADGYTVYLYQPSGSGYNHWTTTDSQFDFSDVAAPGGDWYYKVKATAEEGTRDSEFTESPRKNIYNPSTQFIVGVYPHDDTLDQESSGGEVYLSTSGGDFEWSGDGYTEQVTAGTYVTVKASPADGYRFVEWRQGTQGDTISTNSIYSFTCTGPRYLYAIFEQGDPNETTPITGVSLSGLDVPVVGEYIQYMDGSDLTENPSGRNKYRVIDNQTCSWRDEEGRAINYGGQVFEAGRTYSINFNVDSKDGYAFTSASIPVELYDLQNHEYTGSITLSPESSVATVTFTFTLPGERTYDDISDFRFYGMRAPEDGDTVSVTNGEWAYNNSEMTDRYWTNSEGTRLENGIPFVSGRTYYYNYEFAAFDGYKFAENLFVRADNEVPTNWEYIFNNERTTLHIKIPYFIDAADTVSSIVVDGMFVPNQTKSTRDWDSNVYLSVPNDSNYTIPLQTKSWYEVDAEYSIDTQYKVTEPNFRAGKQYKMFLIVHAKDGYKFAPPETMSFEFSGIPAETYTYTCRSGGSESNIEVVITFTAQFPDDVGENANNPAWCYSYEEFKCAMESNDIRYVALGDVEDVLPAIPHDEEQDPGGITTTAIVVRGHKDLNLLGNAVFRCPLTGNYDLKYYIQLITLTDVADSSLYIHGPGSLTYAGGTLYFVNSAITVDGGHLTVDGTTVRGSNGYHTGYCYGINARRGSVTIQNGATIIGEVYGGDDGICAMAVGEEGEYRSLSVSIFDGKFYVERDTGDGSVDHGITVWNDCGLRIYGMSTDGIRLGRYAADTLADYVMDGTAMTVNGVKSDPATCGTTSGYVEVYTEISEVEIYVETPVAGESATVYPEDVYWVPEGCTVGSIVWYENGEALNLAYAPRFEAGSTYRVEVTLVADNGVRFADPLASAEISYKTAAVDPHGGNAQKGIVMSVDFGECPNVVPEVELTVTAPVEGNTPSYTIGCGSDAYYAVGGSGNYTEYRKWYMSSDNDEWWEINGNHNFMSGYYYKFVVDIRTNNGYEFPLIDMGTIQPDVTATVNGYTATVHKAYEQDPSRYITVEYNFGECNDDVVENIAITNIDAPVAGQTPDYMANCFGTGYSMAGTNSGNWKVNGIVWLRDGNIYTGSIMDNTEKFQAGHEYTVMIDLVADSGYTFLFNHGNSIYAAATINGNTAQRNIENCSANQYQIWYTFTCGKQEIDTITLSGLDAPVGGNVPDTAVMAAYPEYYTVQSVTWTDIEGGAVGATFETGVPYQATIVVEATAQADFTADPAVYIDGSQPNSNNVTVNGNTVTIVYTFSKPASAPEAPAGTTVSGTVKAYNSGSAPVVKLYADGVEKYTAQIGAASASGNQYTWSFTFADVAMGYYDLVVTKDGHLTYTIEDVLVTGQTLDLTANANAAISTISMLAGNMNGDTAINNSDLILFRAQFGKTGNNITNPLANINGDSAVNNSDLIIFRSSFGKTTASCTIAY